MFWYYLLFLFVQFIPTDAYGLISLPHPPPPISINGEYKSNHSLIMEHLGLFFCCCLFACYVMSSGSFKHLILFSACY